MLATLCLQMITKPDVGRLAFRAYPNTGLSSTGAHA